MSILYCLVWFLVESLICFFEDANETTLTLFNRKCNQLIIEELLRPHYKEIEGVNWYFHQYGAMSQTIHQTIELLRFKIHFLTILMFLEKLMGIFMVDI